MQNTSVEISFGLVDVLAKADTSAQANEKQSFIDLKDLTLDGVYAPKSSTLEEDYWKLDGTFDVFANNPEDTTWGFWSLSQSDENGLFENPVELILSFTNLHESIGLTFEFNPHDNSFCNDLNIKWYRDDKVLFDKDFMPDSWRYACMQVAENYDKIKITFKKMNKAYRYLKVQNISHGILKEFGENELVKADILEATDITGTTLASGSLDFTIYSKDNEFDIFNPQGIYTLLQKKQQLSVTGHKGEKLINFGTYYVDELESASNNILSISATDTIGAMDKTTFMGGMYESVPIYNVIEEIMNDAGFGYTLESSLRTAFINGHIPICTHREALQFVAFSVGGLITTCRSGTVNIKSIPNISDVPSNYIGTDRKFLGTKIKLRELITGVDVTEYVYTLSDSTSELAKVMLNEGENLITFSQPSVLTGVSYGTIVEEGANYCVVYANREGECIARGRAFENSQRIIQARLPDVPAGEKENICSVNCPLITSQNSQAISRRLLNTYQYRIEQEMGFVLGNEAVGELAEIETSFGVHRGSVIESMEIDLIKGFKAKAVMMGR